MISEAQDVGHLDERWEQSVGKLIISFGRIEHGIYLAQKLQPALNLSEVTLDLPLAKKLDIALQLIKHRHEDEFEELRGIFGEIKSLLKLRNLVAHNPLVFTGSDDAQGAFQVSLNITSLRDRSKQATLQELTAGAERAKRIAEIIMPKIIRAASVKRRIYRLRI